MLRVVGVSATYGESPVLWDVHLEVRDGEAVCLLGRNGVGKTTLLRSIMGLHPVSRGTVWFGEENLTSLPPYLRARRGLAYVPQGRGILPHLTVEENLRVAAAAAGAGKDQAERLERVGERFPSLRPLWRRKGGFLSGGEQQLLAIARALVMRPKVLLLDEPTEGIQPSLVEEIRRILRQVQEEGIGLLLVEQYLEFAWSLGDRYYVLQKGRVVDEGTTRNTPPQAVAHLLSV